MFRREISREPFHHVGIHFADDRPLLRESKDIPFPVIVFEAGLEIVQIAKLLDSQSRPSTKGLVVMPSDVAVGEFDDLEVSEFAELRVEAAPCGLRHGDGRVEDSRSVGERAKHVRHLTELRLQSIERVLGLGRGFIVG